MRKFRVNVNGKTYEVEVEEIKTNGESTAPQVRPVQRSNNRQVVSNVSGNGQKKEVHGQNKNGSSTEKREQTQAADGQLIKAPLPGTIVSVEIEEGQEVNSGDLLFVLEAMKMQNEITAVFSGAVESVEVEAGDNVNTDQVLAVIE